VEIVRAGAERIPDLQPLWQSLSRHHAQVAPELTAVLGEPRPDAESWAVRRVLYEATGDRVAQLGMLAVLPGHRGQGIGTAPIDRVYAELRSAGVGQLVVSVTASNAGAVPD
jgi:ribosomal protein S18 acetylase RimI-like enzyme